LEFDICDALKMSVHSLVNGIHLSYDSQCTFTVPVVTNIIPHFATSNRAAGISSTHLNDAGKWTQPIEVKQDAALVMSVVFLSELITCSTQARL
jgi:hypothetical protein